ncbi:hydrogenase maturation factor [Lewinella marina]|uniref:AIR synthase n=1 Tax=Neolewinella marina TaxID=438751 RepID=A0A2G0CKH2_9BACT|nr:AIR synthase family protein [Neolewinella marina]NJB84331.1 hydrogenase maturation factor [Neolewinella marina]PHL00469.1 AIR synthase [Neolewinella marina]
MGAFEDQTGKVSARVFKEDLLPRCGAPRPEVIQGPSFGVDTSVIDLGNGLALAVSSDPLSLIPSLGLEVSAWLSVHLLANDMSTTGFPPQYAQFVLNLPASLSRADFNAYWGFVDHLCKVHGIAITGGHTGQSGGQESTLAGGGTMFLTAPRGSILTSNGARAGDAIVVTKSAALSSTSLLAMAFPETVKDRAGVEVQQKAAENFWKLSVLEESRIAAATLTANLDLHGIHDVTEGGVLGALDEMAQAAGLGFAVNPALIPVEPEARAVAEVFGIDPLFAVGAGSMLIAVAPAAEASLRGALSAAGIPATTIGHFTEAADKTLLADGRRQAFAFDGKDPYWAAFYQAYAAGWK